MAAVRVAVEMAVPPDRLTTDETKLNQFAGTELNKLGFVVDYLIAPRVLKRNSKKDSVVIFFGIAKKEKMSDLKRHPRVVDVFVEDTDPVAYAQLLQKKS